MSRAAAPAGTGSGRIHVTIFAMNDNPTDSAAPVIEHDVARNCFAVTVDGHTGIAEYRRDGGVLRLTHTEVPQALEGRGLAAALVREALAYARREGFKVEPLCSYAAGYMQRHPQTHDLRA